MCMLNINAGAVDISTAGSKQYNKDKSSASPVDLLDNLAAVFSMMSASAQSRVYRRVTSSGALPVSRDTPSYIAMMSVLSGGEAGQLRYMTTTEHETREGSTEEDAADFRAEAKVIHQRVASFSQPADAPASESRASIREEDESKASIELQIAAAEEKVSGTTRRTSGNKSSAGMSSLGDLPSLSVPKAHQYSTVAAPKTKASSKLKHSDPTLPKEFLCAINGHVMKEPVRVAATGLVFEKSTIELWLSTRGAVCPITNSILETKDLIPDVELRNKIMRYHIQQTSLRTAESNNDDLYDF